MQTLFGEVKTVDIAAHQAFMDRLRKSEVTADEVRAQFEAMVNAEAGIKAQLSAMTIKELQVVWRARDGKKADMVKHIYSRFLTQYTSPCGDVRTGWYMAQETYEQSLRRDLEGLTDGHIKTYAKRLLDDKEAWMRSITDPQALTEFKTFIHYRGADALSDDQLAVYDILVADSQLEQAEREWQRKAVVEQVQMGDTDLSIKKGWHSKRECDIWIVQLSERVDRAKFNELAEKAKRFGSRWSSFGAKENHGFIFFNEGDAQTFVGLKEGNQSTAERWERREEERQQNAAERLIDRAEHLEEQADEELGRERLTNTHRRVKMALSAEAGAHEQQRMASILGSIGEALAAGKLRYLQHVRHATHVEVLDDLLYDARDEAVNKEANGRYIERGMRRRPQLSDVRLVTWPYPTFHGAWLSDVNGVTSVLRHTEKLKKALGTKDYIALDTPDLLAVADGLLEKAGDKLRWLKERMAPHERLHAMRITSLPMLRAALREYFLHRQERIPQVDAIKLMEYDLVGRKIPGFFPTPEDVVKRVMDEADIRPNMLVLEPSAGKGNLAEAVQGFGATVDCVEVNSMLVKILQAKGFNVSYRDFLEVQFDQYDRVVMNPPFEDGQDTTHVQHAYTLLKPGGRLVAIMSEGPFFRQDKQATAFREWLYEVDGVSEQLAEGSFRESGTNVATRLVVINKQ